MSVADAFGKKIEKFKWRKGFFSTRSLWSRFLALFCKKSQNSKFSRFCKFCRKRRYCANKKKLSREIWFFFSIYEKWFWSSKHSRSDNILCDAICYYKYFVPPDMCLTDSDYLWMSNHTQYRVLTRLGNNWKIQVKERFLQYKVSMITLSSVVLQKISKFEIFAFLQILPKKTLLCKQKQLSREFWFFFSISEKWCWSSKHSRSDNILCDAICYYKYFVPHDMCLTDSDFLWMSNQTQYRLLTRLSNNWKVQVKDRYDQYKASMITLPSVVLQKTSKFEIFAFLQILPKKALLCK